MLGLCGLGYREGIVTEDPTPLQSQDLQGRMRKKKKERKRRASLKWRSLVDIWQWAGFPGVGLASLLVGQRGMPRNRLVGMKETCWHGSGCTSLRSPGWWHQLWAEQGPQRAMKTARVPQFSSSPRSQAAHQRGCGLLCALFNIQVKEGSQVASSITNIPKGKCLHQPLRCWNYLKN